MKKRKCLDCRNEFYPDAKRNFVIVPQKYLKCPKCNSYKTVEVNKE